VLAIVREAVAADDPDARWHLALCGIHLLLSDLGLPMPERLAVLEESRKDLGRRLKVDVRLDQQLQAKYESLSSVLESILQMPGTRTSLPSSGLTALKERSAALKPLASSLRELENSGRLSRTIREQAFSYVHMFANRLLPSAGLQQELVLYDFLKRVYLASG